MSDISKQMPASVSHEDVGVDRIEKHQALQAGQYWRAVRDVDYGDHWTPNIVKDDVHLLQSIDWVDNIPHTVVVRGHPRHFSNSRGPTYKFLVKDFLNAFEFEPEANEKRAEEVREIQGEVARLQNELVESQTNPALLKPVIEDELNRRAERLQQQGKPTPNLPANITQPMAADIGSALSTGVTEETVSQMTALAQRQHEIATITADWIKGKTTQIATTIGKMTPYFEEQAASALAQTEDVRRHIDKVMNGIASLDLYTGKNVYVETIRGEAESAPVEEPLTLMQRRLYMDEELAVFADIDATFDFQSIDLFVEGLKEYPELLEQVLPAKRGIVAISPTRRRLIYSDNATVDAMMNERNKITFLLVRDGDNLHMVHSPVESHSTFNLLFPRKTDTEDIFRGADGRQIKFEDLDYTKKLDEHEQMALHYKRFLILFCGLDHRLDLFGKFYEGPKNFDFISQEFQERYFRFANDADEQFLLADDKPRYPGVMSWVKAMNSKVASGSRIVARWRDLVSDEKCAPGFAKTHGNVLTQSYGVAIVRREGESLVTDVEVSNRYREGSNFIKVYINRFVPDEGIGFLCLDFVEPEMLRHFIYDRRDRVNQIAYIQLFKRALRMVEEDREHERETRELLRQSVIDGRIGNPDEADALVNQAVAHWRALNRGAALPSPPLAGKQMKVMLDHIYNISGRAEDAIQVISRHYQDQGRELLRVSSKGGNFVAYLAPLESEMDNRLVDHGWVKRERVSINKSGSVRSEFTGWAILKHLISEKTLLEADGAKKWLNLAKVDYEQVERAYRLIEDGADRLHALLRMDDVEIREAYNEWHRVRSRMSKGTVAKPALVFPIGAYVSNGRLAFRCVTINPAHMYIYLAKDPSLKAHIKERFLSLYRTPEHFEPAIERAKTLLQGPSFTNVSAASLEPANASMEFIDSAIREIPDMSVNDMIALRMEARHVFASSLPMKDGIPDIDGLLGIDVGLMDDVVEYYKVTMYDLPANGRLVAYRLHAKRSDKVKVDDYSQFRELLEELVGPENARQSMTGQGGNKYHLGKAEAMRAIAADYAREKGKAGAQQAALPDEPSMEVGEWIIYASPGALDPTSQAAPKLK